MPGPRAPVVQFKLCRICRSIIDLIKQYPGHPLLFPMYQPIFDPKMFFSIHMAQKFNQCNFSTGTVAHEILHQNRHWRESEQMQRVQLFLNHIIRHMLTHSGEKPHKCTECKKWSSQAGNLSTHKLIHTGENTHTCAQCKKSFRQTGKLMEHIFSDSEVKDTQLNYRVQKVIQ